jgi:lysyl-tRNA synthetase, class I
MQVQINGLDVEKTVRELLPDNATAYDKEKLVRRVTCAKNWVSSYAEEQFKFAVKDKQDEGFFEGFNETQRIMLNELKVAVSSFDDEESLSTALFDIPKKHDVAMSDFFSLCYQAIIGKDKGPKLAGFILHIGKERILNLL